jgi:predicted component of type VI protein secretion system
MSYHLSMMSADGAERSFPLSRASSIIGRDARCDVLIPLPKVAPRQCEIAVEGALLTLRDLAAAPDAAAATLHNGRPVTRAVLEPGDRVTIGGLVTFVVQVRPEAESQDAPPAPPAPHAARPTCEPAPSPPPVVMGQSPCPAIIPAAA